MNGAGALTPRLGRIEWAALVVAIAIAHLFFWRIVLYPSAFDAQNYLDIASDIERNGLFSKFHYSELRTYGYPLALAALLRLARALSAPIGLVVFEAQLALFIVASLCVRSALRRIAPAPAPWLFVGIVVNPFVLAMTPETLTESVSLSLVLFGAATILAAIARPPTWKSAFGGAFVLGAAVMTRPANLFALLAWAIVMAAIVVAQRPRAAVTALSIVAAAIVGAALPMIPQYANNVRHYGQHTPLLASALGHNQQIWGIAYIKYATALPPVPNPSIFYENPFAKGRPVDETRPLLWYASYPRAGALTLALHGFDMIDQDLMFTYSRDLDPWYRVPVGIANHALVGFAAIGIAMLVSRARRDRVFAFGAIAATAYVVAHVALHATAAVEMRFGLPLLLLAGPAAIAAMMELAAPGRRRASVFAALGVTAYVVAALALSSWVREQAPSIRAWQATHDTATAPDAVRSAPATPAARNATSRT